MKRMTFFGMALDSPNRGINALCVGAIEVVKNSCPQIKEITLVSFRRNTQPKKYKFHTANGSVDIINKFYSKRDILIALKEAFLYGVFRIHPKSELALAIFTSDIIYDLNEGDSFSDIYGLRRILRHFIDSFLAISFRREIVFLPQTIGPFNTFIGSFLGKYVLKRLTKLYVRDSKAESFLEAIKVKYVRTIDLAVYMSPKNRKVELPNDFVAINVNGLMYYNNYSSLKGQFEEYQNILLKVIEYFQNLGRKVLLVPHTYDVKNPVEEDDLGAIKDLVLKNNLQTVQFLCEDYDAQELKYIISRSDFFVGSRMHSCIASLSTSVPTVGLAYSYKFKGTFEMFNSADTVIEINNVHKEAVKGIVQKIASLYEKRDSLRARLKESNIREIISL